MNEDRRQTPVSGHAVSEEGHGVCQIRVKGHLDDDWSEWFAGLSMTHEEDGTTVLTGPLADQPALHGLLIKIRDLGLVLISVNQVEPDSKEALGK